MTLGTLSRTVAAALVATALSTGTVLAQNLRYVEAADIDMLDPAVQRSTPAQIIINQVFETLVKWKDVQLSEIVPSLAESWTVSPDGLTWTFKLRRNVQFQDGTPFDAEAVKFNLERLADEKLASPNRSQYTGIKVAVVDPLTVTMTTAQPSPALIETLTLPAANINSPTAVKKFANAYSRNPVGTGPYMLKEWLPNEHCIIVRNPKYWGEPGKAAQITYRSVPEGGARLVELESGNADIVTGIPPESADRIRNNPKLALQVIPSAFQIFFELNSTKPPFNDVRIRKAVNLGIDREAIVQKILGGLATVPDGLFPPNVQGRVQLKPYPYDPEQARKLIKEVYPDGFKEKLVMWTTSGRYMKDRLVSEAVQSYLNALGFETEFRTWDWASYQRTLYRPEPGGTGKGTNAAHMWLLGTSVPVADWRLRRKVSTGDASNLTGYSNPTVDRLLREASTNMSYPDRMKQYGEIQRIFWEEDAGWLFLFNQVQIIGTQAGVKGLQMFGNEVPDLTKVTK